VTEVADGVHRLGAPLVNWFAVRDGDKLTIIDAGNPDQYAQLPDLVTSLGRSLGDVEAVVLTHAHGDHLGSSALIKEACDADVHVQREDVPLARGETHRAYERHYVRDLTNWYAWKSLTFFLRGGATKAPPVLELSSFDDGQTLDVPGRPRVIHTPGHTSGSVCMVLEDRGVAFTGDALVTLSIVTGETGPRIMPGSFNADSAASLASLDKLTGLGPQTMLPGHGEPWEGSMSDAVEQAHAVRAN
jgi:glyoxylase-like metal-dependent hydrolase (beta-lactamase superfamily II)